MTLRRKKKEAESADTYEGQLSRAEQKKERLDEKISRLKEDKEPYEQESKELYEKRQEKKKIIEKMKGELKTQTDLRM